MARSTTKRPKRSTTKSRSLIRKREEQLEAFRAGLDDAYAARERRGPESGYFRSHAPRRNPATSRQKPLPWGKIALGALAVGIPIYLLTRSSTAYAGVLPGTGGKVPSTGGGTGGARTTPTGGGTPSNVAPSATLQRLLTDQRARQIFNVQAVAYEFGLTDAIPDGVYGPVTRGIINSAQRNAGVGATSTFAANVLSLVRADGQHYSGSTTPTRSLPISLPQGVVSSLNADALAVDVRATPVSVASASSGSETIDTSWLSQVT